MIEKKHDNLLLIENISKTFPGVKALDQINLSLKRGEVLGLVGENGAGKSTLMKILAGVYQPDSSTGRIVLDGKIVKHTNPFEAKMDGIVMIFQELSLVLDLSVAENIFLGSLPQKQKGFIDWDTLNNEAKNVLDSIECCDINPKRTVRSLPIAQQQLVEIGRALALKAKIVIFDEPTSSLTKKETESLFKSINWLKSKGVGIIYISHKLDEIFKLCDRITVFRDGKNSGDFVAKSTTISKVVESMIGRQLQNYYHKSKAKPGNEVIRIENLTLEDEFSDINIQIKRGEVVGLYGLVGAGRTEIVETIFGIRKKSSGNVLLEGAPVKIKSSFDAVKMGIGLVPEDRKIEGLVLGMSCKSNIALAKLPWITNSFGIVEQSVVDGLFVEYKDKLRIATPSALQKVVYLSGGNQQKVVIAKWLSLSPKLLILDEPTRGIDVGSKAEIHKLIAELAESGIAILVISSEMPEIMGICNRIMTISQGRITGEFTGDDISEKNLIDAITPHNYEKVMDVEIEIN